jgi:hypothetical protein
MQSFQTVNAIGLSTYDFLWYGVYPSPMHPIRDVVPKRDSGLEVIT